jgi:hypothetical protein
VQVCSKRQRRAERRCDTGPSQMTVG